MDPTVSARSPVRCTAPRPRGDGPDGIRPAQPGQRCSPPARGWTEERPEGAEEGLLLPARAGMDLRLYIQHAGHTPTPCPCGDGPWRYAEAFKAANGFPPARGRTRLVLRRLRRGGLLPVPGMDPPTLHFGAPALACFPRLRGWNPGPRQENPSASAAPRVRGRMALTSSSRALNLQFCFQPARDVRVSVAWVAVWCRRGRVGGCFVCFGESCLGTCWRRIELLVRKAAPRTRGDGPFKNGLVAIRTPCSPHVRGCTPGGAVALDARPLLPARAGMDPPSRTAWRSRTGAPRARGDGPS